MARDRLLKKHIRERFFFTLDTGETFDGLLDDADSSRDGYYVLVDAGTVVEGSPRVKIDGEFNLPKWRVTYVQRPPR